MRNDFSIELGISDETLPQGRACLCWVTVEARELLDNRDYVFILFPGSGEVPAAELEVRVCFWNETELESLT
jgi:hypothetical protein